MQIEVAFLISALSVIFGIYSGIISMKRRERADTKRESAELTMVIVKLEGISEGITEIKREMAKEKEDIKNLTERLIVAEQSLKSAHKRISEIEKKSI